LTLTYAETIWKLFSQGFVICFGVSVHFKGHFMVWTSYKDGVIEFV